VGLLGRLQPRLLGVPEISELLRPEHGVHRTKQSSNHDSNKTSGQQRCYEGIGPLNLEELICNGSMDGPETITHWDQKAEHLLRVFIPSLLDELKHSISRFISGRIFEVQLVDVGELEFA